MTTGYGNTGNKNTGNKNTGYGNTGDGNTGDWNAGDGNTGNWNAGDGNTGDWNTGDLNTGNGNAGNGNTGNHNAANKCSGYFCSTDPPLLVFDEPCELTSSQLKSLPAYSVLGDALQRDEEIDFESVKDVPNITPEKLRKLHQKFIAARSQGKADGA